MSPQSFWGFLIMIHIYTLADPITKEVRYIGKTNDMRVRYNSHIHPYYKRYSPVKKWIEDLKNDGKFPVMEEIDVVSNNEWIYWEKFYIDLFKSWGFDLLNCKGYVNLKPKIRPITVDEIMNFRLKLLPVPKYFLDSGLHDIEGEIWKDIEGVDGYQVSNMGRVKSLSRAIMWRGCRRVKITSERILKQSSDKDGYKMVSLPTKSTPRRRSGRVHRLVLTAFEGHPPEGKPMCMHADDNPSNNVLSNLSWGNNSENEKQAYARGRKSRLKENPKMRRHLHPMSKAVIQMDLEGTYIKTYLSVSEAAESIGVGVPCICGCFSGKQKTSGGYRWALA